MDGAELIFVKFQNGTRCLLNWEMYSSKKAPNRANTISSNISLSLPEQIESSIKGQGSLASVDMAFNYSKEHIKKFGSLSSHFYIVLHFVRRPSPSPPMVWINYWSAFSLTKGTHEKSVDRDNKITQQINATTFLLDGWLLKYRQKNTSDWICRSMRTQNLTICLVAGIRKTPAVSLWVKPCCTRWWLHFLVVKEQGPQHLFPNHSDCSCSFTSFIVKRLLHIEEHIGLGASDSMLINSGYPGIITSVPLIV